MARRAYQSYRDKSTIKEGLIILREQYWEYKRDKHCLIISIHWRRNRLEYRPTLPLMSYVVSLFFHALHFNSKVMLFSKNDLYANCWHWSTCLCQSQSSMSINFKTIHGMIVLIIMLLIICVLILLLLFYHL